MTWHDILDRALWFYRGERSFMVGGILIVLTVIVSLASAAVFIYWNYAAPPPWVELGLAEVTDAQGRLTNTFRAGENVGVARTICANAEAGAASVHRYLESNDSTRVLLPSGPSERRHSGCASMRVEVALPIELKPGRYSYRSDVDVPLRFGPLIWKTAQIELSPIDIFIVPNEALQKVRIIEKKQQTDMASLAETLRVLRLDQRMILARQQMLLERMQKVEAYQARPWYWR